MPDGHSGGAHTQFKDKMREDLLTRVGVTIKQRAGPSWEERMEKSVKGFKARAKVVEDAAKKDLSDAIDKGNQRATSCPHRDPKDAPNQKGMLVERMKQMKKCESDYKDTLDALKTKMENREPLFRLSEVNAAFAMQREKAAQKKREMAQDESERWAHMRSLEQKAATRPLLIEDYHFKPEKAKPVLTKSKSAPDAKAGGEGAAAPPTGAGVLYWEGGDDDPKYRKIQEAIGQNWFQNSDWAQTVREIKERADNRQKLHEIKYPNKGDGHVLTRGRMMHTLPSQVPAVY